VESVKPKLKCWACGCDDLMITPTMLEPLKHQGNELIFTVCPKCWQVNEFVNGESVQIVIVPRRKEDRDALLI